MKRNRKPSKSKSGFTQDALIALRSFWEIQKSKGLRAEGNAAEKLAMIDEELASIK